MEILELKVMNGPNYWSVMQHKIIVLRVDVAPLEEFSASSLQSIIKYMETSLPGIQGLELLMDFPLPFNKFRAGHALANIALYLQQKAGYRTDFYKVYDQPQEDGIVQLIFEYEERNAGIYAGEASVKLLNALLSLSPVDTESIIQELRDLREEPLGPSTRAIVEEARRRNIPFKRMECGSFIMFGQGANSKRIRSSVCDSTSSVAMELAADREAVKELLQTALIPVPKGMVLRKESQLKEAIRKLHFPLVVKPVYGNQGKATMTNIDTREGLLYAFMNAKSGSGKAIVEQFITGNDFRVLVINYKIVAAAKRTPAYVVGDGHSTIEQLVEKLNNDPRRGTGHSNILTKIKIDQRSIPYLEAQGLTPQSVLPEKMSVFLKDAANLSAGGSSKDVTDRLHPENAAMLERVARVLGLDVCGIDIMAPDLDTPIRDNGGAVIEVHAAPGLRMHFSSGDSKSGNVAAAIMDLLYPHGKESRIPIIGVTGTNGKTTTTRLMAHLARTSGYQTGFTSTDGIYVKDQLISKGDSSGPKSAAIILSDPAVDFAVLECARGGMLRSGLAFDHCNVAIVTNVAADHLGLKGINTVQDMANVKSVLPKTVLPDGYAVLNADDDLVYGMSSDLSCKIALFSLDPENERIREHRAGGGMVATVDAGYITVWKGNLKKHIEKVVDIPLTYSGRASFMIQNVLAATLAAVACNFPQEQIKLGLQTFFPGPGQTPGRLNLFRYKDFEVMVDYAHNPHGLRAVGSFLEQMPGRHKVGIIAAAGDRREGDMIEMGTLAAGIFDEIIVRQDTDLRGNNPETIEKWFTAGLEKGGAKNFRHIHKENEAIIYALENAKQNSLIFICSEDIGKIISLLKDFQNEEKDVVA